MKISGKDLKNIKNNGILFSRIRRSLLSAINMQKLLHIGVNDDYSRELFFSFYDAMLVSYGSCFNQCGKGVKKLEKNIFNGNDYLKEIHIKLIKIRNELVAHNGWSELLELSLNEEKKGSIIKLKFNVEIIIPTIEGLDQYIEVMRFLYDYLTRNNDLIIENINKKIEKFGMKYEFCKDI